VDYFKAFTKLKSQRETKSVEYFLSLWSIQMAASQLFVWEPQEACSPAQQKFDQCCILSLKIYSESFRYHSEMTEKNPLQSTKKPEKAQKSSF
jgi:hypothetical protein